MGVFSQFAGGYGHASVQVVDRLFGRSLRNVCRHLDRVLRAIHENPPFMGGAHPSTIVLPGYIRWLRPVCSVLGGAGSYIATIAQ
jgi:hypothetical protein